MQTNKQSLKRFYVIVIKCGNSLQAFGNDLIIVKRENDCASDMNQWACESSGRVVNYAKRDLSAKSPLGNFRFSIKRQKT